MTGVDPKPITIIMEPSLLAKYVYAVGRAPQRVLHAGSHATAAPRSQSFPFRSPFAPVSERRPACRANAVRAAVWKFVIGHGGGALCGCHGRKNCREFFRGAMTCRVRRAAYAEFQLPKHRARPYSVAETDLMFPSGRQAPLADARATLPFGGTRTCSFSRRTWPPA